MRPLRTRWHRGASVRCSKPCDGYGLSLRPNPQPVSPNRAELFGTPAVDGGYTSDMKGTLTALLQAKQPDAVGYNGGGISANAVRWSGTEGDVPPCGSGTRKGEKSCPDVWCTACCDTCWGAGCRPDHDNATYYPSGTDYTLQAGDVWFYEPQAPLRHLDELIFTYHSTVGHNTAMELDFAIDRTGRVDPAHAALYKRFGDWRRSCYGTPSQEVQVSFVGPHSIVMPAAPDGHSQTLIDRVVASEDLRAGQQVTGYTVEVKTLHGWVLFGSGQSIGSKRIHLGDGQQSYNASAVRVNVTAALGPVQLTLAAFHPCDTGGLAGLTRLGTADIGMTETTPIVVNDTLYRFESVRGDYWNNSKQGMQPPDCEPGALIHPTRGNRPLKVSGAMYSFRLLFPLTGPAVGPTSYLRLRQQSREADGWRIGPTVTPPFGVGYGLGCAVVEDETQEVWAFATQEANAVSVWHSQGLNTWVPGVAITAPSGWKIFNTAVAKGVLAGTVVYAMALEVGAPFHGFDLIFATSTSLAGPWTLGATAPGSVTLGAGPGSCPALRYDSASGYWQLLYTPNPTVRAGGYRTWQIYAMRSRSLATGTWEASPNNPVLVADSRDRVIHNRDLPLAIQQWARNTTNLNNSDPDLVEVDGKVLLVLNWGDQRSTPTDNLAQVVFNGTLAEFWQSLYPTY